MLERQYAMPPADVNTCSPSLWQGPADSKLDDEANQPQVEILNIADIDAPSKPISDG
jgi:hypothetical protein